MTNRFGRIQLIDDKLHINGTVRVTQIKEAMEITGANSAIVGSEAKVIGGIRAKLQTEPNNTP